MFKPQKGSGVEDDEVGGSDQNVAKRAFDLLKTVHMIPGLSDDGRIDTAKLKGWVDAARAECSKAGRSVIGEQYIGMILSAAPPDERRIWPAIPVRDLIEQIRCDEVENGIVMGVYNRRGVTSRGSLDGGEQERELAFHYKKLAKTVEHKWKRTAAVLRQIAKSFERDGKRYDEDVEKQQW
jgi:hypothetical protein